MDKTSKITDEYKPNEGVKVTVVNAPKEVEGKQYFTRTVTIKVDKGLSDEKLVFSNADEIEKFVNDVDFEDPQQQLV